VKALSPGGFYPCALAILVVDDDAPLADSLAAHLRLDGHRVAAAHAVAAAQAALLRRPMDLVITDICMTGPAGREGLTLLDWIKVLHPATEVVVMSGYGDGKMEEASLRLGGFRFFHKPADPELFRILARSLAQCRAGIPPPPPTSGDVLDPEVARRLQREYLSGNEQAFGRLLAGFRPLILSVCRCWYGLDGAASEDVVQDVGLSLILKMSKIRELRPYVVGTALHLCRKHAKHHFLPLPHDFDPPTLPESRDTWDPDIAARMIKALKSLSDKERSLLNLLFTRQAPYEEIAGMLGIPRGSIGPTRNRILAKLRAALRSQKRS